MRDVRADLSHVTTLGARTRKHRYFRDARTFALPVVVAFAALSLVYLPFALRAGRGDWQTLALIGAALACVPLLTAFTLTAFRRHQAPIITAVATTAIVFSFAVTLLSAFRIPVSYMGLALSLPAAMLVMAHANIRFQSAISSHVAIIAFRSMQQALELMGPDVAVIRDPEADISGIDTVLIDPSQHHNEKWSALLARCYLSGIEIIPWTRFMEIRLGRVDIASFDLSHLTYSPSQLLYARLKRGLDLFAVVATLPVTIVLAALVAGYVLARDGGPVLFVQHRRGFDGKPFRMYKFRTMYTGTGGGATRASDDRIIPGCRFIRRVRLDELPQLYNILIGNMSLIGPRPEAIDLARWYQREIPEYAYRLLALPGVTGWAQVNSGYTSNPGEARIKLSYDLYYIKYMSFDLDLQILFRTVRTVLFGSGAR